VAIAVVGLPCTGQANLLTPADRAQLVGDAGDDVVIDPDRSKPRIKPSSIVHYNLLHQAKGHARSSGSGPLRHDWSSIVDAWDFASEPAFRAMFESRLIDRCIVMVVPTSELQDRMKGGGDAGASGTASDREFWEAAMQHLPLARIYELLFQQLDARGVPYEVVMSSTTVGLVPTDRVFVHHNLRGKHISLPDPEVVHATANSPNCVYQSVRLPHSIVTRTQGNDHLPKDRDWVLAALLPNDIAGSSVLDIGSAMGALLFVAERMGAERLVGVEIDHRRHAGSVSLAEVLHSQVHLQRGDFEAFSSDETFDHVLALNVLHHVPNFRVFLEKAAFAASKTLTLEFPTLIDHKFAHAHRLAKLLLAPLNRLPLIGVSSIRAVDQTYVYSPVAVKHLVMNEIGGFRSCVRAKSENSHRVVMRFSR